ncbi:MAG: hypothetical protein LBC69_04010 [Eubacteriaceae bacterium]|jgi:2,3-bisphosphoglycerate-independent phosphoglycerate mutase|nr:hypothetical protein [Eubacteriaceae bacterium]
MKHVLAIIDGMTNSTSDAFNEAFCQSPLKGLFDSSLYGWLDTTPKGFDADSLCCIPTLLGVPPDQIPKGRAYCECIAGGIKTEEGDLLFRCNPASLDGGILVSANSFGLTEEEYAEIASIIEQCEGEVELHHMHGYKNVLIFKGLRESISEIKTFPPHQNVGRPLEDILPFGGKAGERARSFVLSSQAAIQKRLKRDMAFLPWGESVTCSLPLFSKLFGLDGISAVCRTEVVQGICSLMGFLLESVEGATGDTDTNLDGKAQAAIAALDKSDFVLVHINGADEAAHRFDGKGKAEFVRQVAERVICPIAESLDRGARLMVSSDHSTDPLDGSHGGAPQPFFLFQKGFLRHRYAGRYPGVQAVPLLMAGGN